MSPMPAGQRTQSTLSIPEPSGLHISPSNQSLAFGRSMSELNDSEGGFTLVRDVFSSNP
jgi:hypothetical protein